MRVIPYVYGHPITHFDPEARTMCGMPELTGLVSDIVALVKSAGEDGVTHREAARKLKHYGFQDIQDGIFYARALGLFADGGYREWKSGSETMRVQESVHVYASKRQRELAKLLRGMRPVTADELFEYWPHDDRSDFDKLLNSMRCNGGVATVTSKPVRLQLMETYIKDMNNAHDLL